MTWHRLIVHEGQRSRFDDSPAAISQQAIKCGETRLQTVGRHTNKPSPFGNVATRHTERLVEHLGTLQLRGGNEARHAPCARSLPRAEIPKKRNATRRQSAPEFDAVANSDQSR